MSSPLPSPVSRLVELPPNLAGFRSAHSPLSPLIHFRDYLARETRLAGLSFAEVLVPVTVYAALRETTRAWAKATGRVDQLDQLTAQGVTAPRVSNRVPSGHAQVGGAA